MSGATSNGQTHTRTNAPRERGDGGRRVALKSIWVAGACTLAREGGWVGGWVGRIASDSNRGARWVQHHNAQGGGAEKHIYTKNKKFPQRTTTIQVPYIFIHAGAGAFCPRDVICEVIVTQLPRWCEFSLSLPLGAPARPGFRPG